nr:ABC transporter substrate-binding protein [Pseudochelatococcus contaminans]
MPVATGIFPGPYIARASELKKINVGWTGSSICHNSLPSAFHKGFFQKHGLEPELLAFGGGNDAVLEALSSGKIDVTIGFILRLLKPLEQGANIRFTGSVHGGCIRVVAAEGTPEVDYASLKGKSIGVSSLASPSKNFLSVQLHKAGINPQSDVEWRVYPVDLFAEAIKKGEIQAAADADPGTFLLLRNNRGFLKEIGGQDTGIYSGLSCCAVTVSKAFVEERPKDAAAATYALTEAAQWVFENPDESSLVAAKYSPHPAPLLAEVIRSHRHDVNYTANRRLRDEVAIYANDLREVGVIRRRTDPEELAKRATIDIEV